MLVKNKARGVGAEGDVRIVDGVHERQVAEHPLHVPDDVSIFHSRLRVWRVYVRWEYVDPGVGILRRGPVEGVEDQVTGGSGVQLAEDPDADKDMVDGPLRRFLGKGEKGVRDLSFD